MLLLALTHLPTSVVSEPNPIYDATQYSRRITNVTNGALFRVTPPDTELNVAHLYGTPFDRGYAHGHLLHAQVIDLVQVQLPLFYKEEIASLTDQLRNLPAWLRNAIEALLPLAEDAAPKMFDLALGWVEQQQRSFNTGGAEDLYTQIRGLAEGVCAGSQHAALTRGAAAPACDPDAFEITLRKVNMLPELIKMQCSMVGAWGSATPTGSLVQLRSLDFGAGPFANVSTLLVHHPTSAAGEAETPYASLGFPGMVGVITGFSSRVGISEKVDDISGGSNPPGSFNGRAVSFVIADMLRAADENDAHRIALAAQRTWGVWLGVGGQTSQRFLVIDYQQASAKAYNESTLPSRTSQPAMRDLAYVDKHAQPSGDSTLPALLEARRGSLTADLMAQDIPRLTGSGDVHIAIYDYSPARPTALIALGRVAANGSYVGKAARKAFEAPFMKFDLNALWNQLL